MFNRKFETPSAFARNDVVYNYDDYFYQIRSNFQKTWQIARSNINSSKIISKRYYDGKTFKEDLHVGEQVLIRNRLKKHKLDVNWSRPFEIQNINDNETITIRRNNKNQVIHRNEVIKFN